MSQVPSLLSTHSSADQPFGAHNTLNDLDIDTFLKLMITELQNQDPLNPLDNSEILAQINQIREVTATDMLTNTLNSVLLGQNIASSTNLIGADVDAISDDNQPVSGNVSRVSINGGEPKLELDLETSAAPSIEKGNLEPGTYSYRIEWQSETGRTMGIELSGAEAVSTHPVAGNDYQSIELRNLPRTSTAKRIYRTNASGEGDYRLVAVLTDGSQSTFRDTTADDARSQTRQTAIFDPGPRFRRFTVSLNNVAQIRAPSL